jgi:hypothetical protein
MAEAKLVKSQLPVDPLPGLFVGNSDSLVARAVGSAEGTRTPNGAINPAYFGHTDPGNRVWNMGTFSYQHGAKTPEEADQKQLARLKNQGAVLRQRALQHGLNLTLEETLNGLDLANQSPLAAIGRVGYIERLAEAKASGFEGSEAILVARTRSYINPNTGRWNAPGLGNTETSIRRDQQRRANAVAQAIAAYESQNPQLQAQAWTLTPSPEPATEDLVALANTQAEPVDDFLQMWTSPSDPVAQAATAADSTLMGQAAEAEAQSEDDPSLASPNVATGDRVLAALWQFTMDKVSPLGLDAESESGPQAASLAGVLFNHNTSPAQPQDKASEAEAADESTTEAASPVVLEAPVEVAGSTAIAPPTWSEVREGNQSNPTAEAVPGAFPDSTIYAPAAPAEPPVTEASLAEVAQAEPSTPAPAAMPDSLVAEPEAAPTAIPSAVPATLAPEGTSENTPMADRPPSPLETPAPTQLALDPKTDAINPAPDMVESTPLAPAPGDNTVLSFDKVDATEALSAEASLPSASDAIPAKIVPVTADPSNADQTLAAEPEAPASAQDP